MCSVLLLHRTLPDAPLAVLFVRDEDLTRGGTPPEIRPDAPAVLAPRDPRGGGTWFGVSGRGFLAGLVNRKGDPLPEEALSRGQLLLAALAEDSAEAALARAARLAREGVYGGCRVFAGDARLLAWVDLPVTGHPSPSHPLAAGAWLLRHTHQPEPAPALFLPRDGEGAEAWLGRALDLAARHEPAGEPFCHHGQTHGSVDLSAVVLGSDGRPAVFRHQTGAPCSGEAEDYSLLLDAL